MALLLLEAAACLRDQVVPSAEALDLALCQAFWPAHRGGPIHYARTQDQPALAATFAALAAAYGPRFQLGAEAEAILRG